MNSSNEEVLIVDGLDNRFELDNFEILNKIMLDILSSENLGKEPEKYTAITSEIDNFILRSFKDCLSEYESEIQQEIISLNDAVKSIIMSFKIINSALSTEVTIDIISKTYKNETQNIASQFNIINKKIYEPLQQRKVIGANLKNLLLKCKKDTETYINCINQNNFESKSSSSPSTANNPEPIPNKTDAHHAEVTSTPPPPPTTTTTPAAQATNQNTNYSLYKNRLYDTVNEQDKFVANALFLLSVILFFLLYLWLSSMVYLPQNRITMIQMQL